MSEDKRSGFGAFFEDGDLPEVPAAAGSSGSGARGVVTPFPGAHAGKEGSAIGEVAAEPVQPSRPELQGEEPPERVHQRVPSTAAALQELRQQQRREAAAQNAANARAHDEMNGSGLLAYLRQMRIDSRMGKALHPEAGVMERWREGRVANTVERLKGQSEEVFRMAHAYKNGRDPALGAALELKMRELSSTVRKATSMMSGKVSAAVMERFELATSQVQRAVRVFDEAGMRRTASLDRASASLKDSIAKAEAAISKIADAVVRLLAR